MLVTVPVQAFFSERTSYFESSEPACKFPVYRPEEMKKMTGAAFLPFKRVMGQYSSI